MTQLFSLLFPGELSFKKRSAEKTQKSDLLF
jgi:hypothetical protein